MEMQSVRVFYKIVFVSFPLHVFLKSILKSIEYLRGTFWELAVRNETSIVKYLYLYNM